MSLITVPVSGRDGARVQVRVSLNRPTVLALRAARQPVPPAVVVTALIDTGAEQSCVDPSVAARAALPLHGFGFAAAPGATPPAPAFGGATLSTRHQAGLAVVHPAGRPDLVIPDIIVQALPLLSFGIEAVIGRDVLAGCVLVYNGPAGSATLAY